MMKFIWNLVSPIKTQLIVGVVIFALTSGLIGAAWLAKRNYDFRVAEAARREFVEQQLKDNNTHLQQMTELYRGLLEASNRHTEELRARNDAAQLEANQILEEIRKGNLQGTNTGSSEVLRQTIRRLRGE